MVSERVEAWLRRHPVVVDSLLTLLLLVPCVLPYQRRGGLVILVALGLVLPLAVRRRYPVLSASVILSTAFVQWLTLRAPDVQLMAGDVGVLAAVYAATAYGPRWAARTALAAGLTGAALGGQLWPVDESGMESRPLDHVVVGLGFGVAVIAVWSIGRLRGLRREQVEALRERARLLEVERDQRARLAVSAERARIAREMHDVVAHSLAVMIAQADGGRYAATDSPRAQAVLETIGDTGRQALAEMRRLLAVLRDGAPGDDPARMPQPGLADVPALVQRVREGGLHVTLSDVEACGELEAGLGLVVFRIVQEGLTNVIKHAGPAASAQVQLRRVGPALEVSVVDDGRGVGAVRVAGGAGHGLVGMRERASAYGGTVEAGPALGGGYAVRARIPVPAS